jgi:hypothetical protein
MDAYREWRLMLTGVDNDAYREWISGWFYEIGQPKTTAWQISSR